MARLIILLCLCYSLPSLILAEYFRVCYVTNWSQYRNGLAKYDLSKHYISGICTHLVFSFAKIEEKSKDVFALAPIEHNDLTVGYPQTQAWKQKDSKLKTMLSVGGYSFGSAIFSKMVETEQSRRSFITSSVAYLKKWGFDGLDIDWEFPGKRDGSSPEDKPNFSKLCKEIKEEFTKHDLIVSAAVIAETHGIEKSYDIAEIFKHLDFINLMAYDLHGPWETSANHHTDSNPDLPEVAQSMDNTISKYISLGAVPDKIVLGLAAYGKVFELDNACDWKLYSTTTGKSGTKGPYTGESGLLAYYEICRMNMDGRVCTKNSKAYAPYASKGTDFINYDDEESIQLKVKRLVKGKTPLKGIMIWSLDFDDFSNACNTGKYPIWQAAIDALNGIDKSYDNCKNVEKSCIKPTTSPSPGSLENYDTGDYIRVCYFTNWSQYRKGVGKFDLTKNYPTGMCTHIIYAYAKIEKKENEFKISPIEWNDITSGYPKTALLKTKDSKLKTLLSVTEANGQTIGFSEMMKTKESRTKFIANAIKFIQNHKFDGIDVTWNSKRSSTDDKPNFTEFCKEMKVQFAKKNLILTISVQYISNIDEVYDITEVSKHLDFINVQGYGLYSSTHPTTSHHTAMQTKSPSVDKTVPDFILNSFINKGVATNKLILGLALYGTTSALEKPCDWDLGYATKGKGGKPGAYTQASGFLAYYEICSTSWNNHVCTRQSPVKVPYGATDVDYIAYENEESIAKKVKDITIKHKLKGIMFWTLEFDDFSGSCSSNTKYPLIMSSIKALKGLPVPSKCKNQHSCGTAPDGLKPSIDPGKYYRVCYFTNWAQYRTGKGKYDVTKHYEKGLCTHILYAFAKVEKVGDESFKISPYEWNDETVGYKQVTSLKEKDAKLKVLLSVGGINHGSSGFTDMVKTEERRKSFISSSATFLKKHNFDGINIAWFYPTRNKGSPEDKTLFTKFLQELKTTFSAKDFLVTVTVDGKVKDIDTSYEVKEISQNVDFINVNAYSYSKSTDETTAHHADATDNTNKKDTTLSSIDAWISKGADASKIVVGLSSFAHTMTLKEKCEHGLGDLTKKDGGIAGSYTKSSGVLAYYEVCKTKWSSRICTKSSSVNAPFGSTDSDFISYDDPESVAFKLKKTMIAKQLRGFSVWSLDLDDFNNMCGSGTYPILKTAKDVAFGFDQVTEDCINLKSSCPSSTRSTTTAMSETTTTTPETTTTTPETTTTTSETTTTTPETTTTTPETTTTTPETATTISKTTTTTPETTTTTPETTTTTQEATTTTPETTTTTPETTTTIPETTTTTSETKTTIPETTSVTPKTTTTTPTTTTTAPTTSTTNQKRTETKTAISTQKPSITIPLPEEPDNTFSRVCFLSNEALEWDGKGKFDISNQFERDLCTHLIYTGSQIVQLGFGNIFELRINSEFKNILWKLKFRDEYLKVMLGVGSLSVNVNSLKILMNKKNIRYDFFESAAKTLKNFGFDGIDVNWNPPLNIAKSFKFKFTLFCNELKTFFKSKGLLVSATLSGDIVVIDNFYEVDKITNSLDFINVLTYNYYDKTSTFAAHNADARSSSSRYDKTVDNTMQHWIRRGANTKKLNLGLATYGRTYQLKRPSRDWKVGSPVYGGGYRGDYTKTSGLLAYFEICTTRFENHVCTESSVVRAPFGSDGKMFIAYDDPESIQYKVKTFMLKYNLKGFMISHIGYDDFDDRCGHGTFPLLKAARQASRQSKQNLQFKCKDIYAPVPTFSTSITTTTGPNPQNGEDLKKTRDSSGTQLKFSKMAFLTGFIAVMAILL